MEKNRVKIHCDGASNSFESAFCVCLKKGNGKHIYHLETFNKKFSASKIEYMAIISALEFAEGCCDIYSDCKTIVNQLNSSAPFGNLKYYERAKELINKKDVRIIWISRNDNLAGIFLEKRLSEMRKGAGLDRKFVYRPGRRRK